MKKNYIQPFVEQAQLMPSSIVLAGSPGGNPGVIQNNGNGTNSIGDSEVIGG